jgi:hypothetical protein
MVIETKTYEIYAGIGKSDDDVTLVDTVEMDSDLEARDYAELCAMSLYNLNPKRYVSDIIEQDDVSKEKAMEIYKKEARESVVFFALEYEADGTMTRHY